MEYCRRGLKTENYTNGYEKLYKHTFRRRQAFFRAITIV